MIENNNNNMGSGNEPPRRTRAWLVMFIISIFIILMMHSVSRMITSQTTKEITYNEFMAMLDAGIVKSVEIDSDQIRITPVDSVYDKNASRGNMFGAPIEQKKEEVVSSDGVYVSPAGEYLGMVYYTGIVNDPDLTSKLLAAGVEFKEVIPDRPNELMSIFLSYILPVIIMVFMLSFLMRRIGGGGVMGVGKSKAKVYMQKETGVTFADVAGQEEAKESLQECVDFLHNPDKYVRIGAKLPKGCLLVGPPGTGKTLLAKAVAGEAEVPFFSLAGSDFVEMFVGVGASRVRDLFSDAQKNAPCIIFIDEIDAIGKSRDSRHGSGNDEREQTLNQLLAEMDGFDSAKGILILAATNRPEILDKALLRPGRFDRRVIVEKPDLKGRIDTLKVHSKNVKMDETVDLEEIALATSGAVGSDLANMVNEAAINAVKNKRQFVSQKDLFDAVEVVLVGKEKKDRIMSKEERRIVSYHEIGHALIMALQKNSEPVQKITIVPRTMGALGYVMQVPEEEKFLNTEAELHDMLVSYLGGRAAEDIVFDTVTTGASNDIEKATKVARAMITQYGMSKKLGLVSLEVIESQYLDHRAAMNCSETKAAEIDDEVQRMMKDAYKEAKRMLKDNRALLDKLAAHLIEKETITGKEFMKIYRAEKGLPEEDEKDSEKVNLKKTSGNNSGQSGNSVSGGNTASSNNPAPAGYMQQGQMRPGQPMYGQPMYGQPMYGRPMYGRPMPGQPMYGRPMPGQPYPYKHIDIAVSGEYKETSSENETSKTDEEEITLSKVNLEKSVSEDASKTEESNKSDGEK